MLNIIPTLLCGALLHGIAPVAALPAHDNLFPEVDALAQGLDDDLQARGLVLPAPQICGTKPPTPQLREVHQLLREERTVSLAERATMPTLVIDTYIHWVSTQDQAKYYTTSVRTNVVGMQMAAMNTAYKPAGISFRLKSSTYSIRDDWATDANSTAMKQNLRRGTYQSLNIYFQSNLSSSPGSSGSSTLLGYCTLPTTITYGNPPTEYPAQDYATDGCNILTGSMPGVPHSVNGYNQGKTAVHEVGHWFGLLHTFQDDTCAFGDPGDYVNDTPQQCTATSGCPKGKDSCPNSPGKDAINNYMDYSTDACYTNFSPNQIQRMNTLFNLYRKGY